VRALVEAQRRTDEEIRELKETVRALVEAQRRTDEEIRELKETVRMIIEEQRRLAQEQQRLAEEHRRFAQEQQRLAEEHRRFAQEQQRLAEEQRRFAEGQDEMREAIRRLGIAVGELQNAFGVTLEEEAGSVAAAVMRMKGYRVLQEPFSLAFDGEIDIVLPVEDSTGQRLWVVLEVKARLNQRDVMRWAQRMRSESWHRALAEKGCPGPYLVYVYGIRVDLTARQAAEAEGIGLMKSDGEIFPPRGLVAAAVA
ncbi:MAG: hypothetical protein RMM31_10055, partial [Anaerolineae bacterium]|nr:hypothetical protein [Anaerolineae bacterium]